MTNAPTEKLVILDTNVLVSALLTPDGNPSVILKAVIDGELVLVYSAAIMSEYRSVLARPKFSFDALAVLEVLEFIEVFGEMVEPAISDSLLPDEGDRPFYDTSSTTGVTLVTGNVRHFPSLINVMTPAEYVQTYVS